MRVPDMGKIRYEMSACIQKYKVPQPKQQKAPMKCTIRTFVSWKLPTKLMPRQEISPNHRARRFWRSTEASRSGWCSYSCSTWR